MGSHLPYDAEVEYLENTGTQYINSDITIANDIGIVIDAMSKNSTTQYHAIGVYLNNSNNCLCVFGSNAGGIMSCFGRSEDRVYANLDWRNTRHVIYLNKGIFYVDNQYIGTLTPNVIGESKIWIGAINNITIHKGRIYGAQIFKNDILIFDGIPVRIGTTGYMYDKVSGQLFGNAGTGDFILGPDK
jgi:hypothetical protein